MLLIDSVKYELWTPPSEDAFEQVVKEHALDIFGENSMYLDTKQKLKSKAGIGSIPDGYAIVFNNPPSWHIVEMELSNHPIYDHVVTQVSKFITGIKNHSTQKELVNTICEIIDSGDLLKLKIRKAIEPAETYRFLSELVSKPPELTVIIEQRTETLDEALSSLANPQSHVIEFRTFVRYGTGLLVHAHLFEPLYKTKTVPIVTVIHEPPVSGVDYLGTKRQIELTICSPTFIKFHLFSISKRDRQFFPGYKVLFKLETDIGEIETHVSSAPAGTQIGDPHKGAYIQKNLAKWYREHPMIRVGDKVIFEVIEPMKRYRLRKA